MDQHDEHCGCGGHHHGEAHGHHHHHDNGSHCGCGCGCEHREVPTPEGLTPVQCDVLLAIYQRHCLPVACFALTKAGDEERYAIALAPVHLNGTDDTLEQVKWLGNELSGLEAMDLITLDYDMPIKGYDYVAYQTSQVYAYFEQTVAESKHLPDRLFDTPVLELGSMALTDAGEKMAEKLMA